MCSRRPAYRPVRPCSAGPCFALLLTACSVVSAQDNAGTSVAADVPLWMPRPSRYLDRPMTKAEVDACRRRTDLPKRGPHPHPATDAPPAPRCLLEDVVTADVSGTVVEVMRALMAQSGWEWLVSIREGSADKTAQFAARDMPLWQALDMLLEVYGYDWGLAHGAIVCWPALIPARERAVSPGPVPDGEAQAAADAATLDIREPTWAEEVLPRFHPTSGALDWRVTLDARLRDWKLVGRVAAADRARGIRQVAAALNAVVQGDPTEGAVCMGAHMWLDRAMRGADARAAELKSRGVSLEGMCRIIPLKDSLRALFTAQQWSLMDLGGEAVIWFRELPLEVAELWVLTARAGEGDWARAAAAHPGVDYSVDWSRPEDFLVMAWQGEDLQPDPADGLYRIVGRHLVVSAVVATKDGGGRGI